MYQEQWERITRGLITAVQNLDKAGADFIIIATNTMHYVLPDIREKASIPILSVVDATADAIEEQGLETVGLLGT